MNATSTGYVSVGFPSRPGLMTDATAMILQVRSEAGRAALRTARAVCSALASRWCLPFALGSLALLCVGGCLGLLLTYCCPFNGQACAAGEAGCSGGAKLVQWYMSGLKQSGGSAK